MGLLPEAIGVGPVAIFAFGEIFGLAAGGMVVPGYLALQFDQPLRRVGTLVLAGLVFALMRGAHAALPDLSTCTANPISPS